MVRGLGASGYWIGCRRAMPSGGRSGQVHFNGGNLGEEEEEAA